MTEPLDRTTATGVDLGRSAPSLEGELDTVDASGMATMTAGGVDSLGRVKRASATSTGRGSGRNRELAPLELGARVGDYVLEQRLGAGGMGEVFAARHVRTDELVALKTLSSTTATRLYRFKREFRALADVSHRNLIRLYELVVPDVGQTSSASLDSISELPDEHDGLAFFTMELLDGEPFVDWLRGELPDGVLPDLRRLNLGLRQLVEGLVHLHAHDCIHRDIKPSNVLVTTDDRVVVLDFGLVSELSGPDKGITRDGQLLGTPSYMAPEQAIAQRVSAAADHYAIGVMLYQCLTGKLPFHGSAMQQLVEKQSGRVPDPRSEVADVPDAIADLCMRLMAREPEDRPTSQQLLEFVRAKRSTPSPGAGAPSQVFVGRKAELAELHAAVDELQRGPSTEAVIVHLRGPSGAGKSVLIRQLRSELPEHRLAVLQGRCREREIVPYKGVDALIDSLSAYLRNLSPDDRASLRPSDLDALTRVFPVLGEIWDATDEQILGLNEARALGWTTLRKLLERTATREPIILHIDDFQWADLDSVQLLEALVASPGSPRIMLLISYRTAADGEPETPALRHLLASDVLSGPRVRKLDLPPLSSDDAQALADALLTAGNKRGDMQLLRTRAAAIALRSAGNPLFIAQMALGGRELESSDADLDHVIRRRIADFDEPRRRVLELIAVYGGPMPALLAVELCPTAGIGHIASLCELGLLVRDGEQVDARDERVEVADDRVRVLVLDAMPEHERVELHARIGARLLAMHDGAPSGDALFLVVNHLNAGRQGQLDDARRLELVRLNYAAGKLALESTAWTTARDVLEHAHALIEPWLPTARSGAGEHALCVDVEFARAQALISLEQPEGDAAIEQLLTWQLSISDYCRVTQWYAWHLFPTTRWDECVAFGRRVLPRLGFSVPRSSWLRAIISAVTGWRRLMRLGVDRIHTLPPITDERIHAALEIILIVSAQARATDIKLHLTLVGVHARLLARHGFHDGAGVALANLGMLAAALGKTERAKQLCEYAQALPDKRSVPIHAQSAAQAIEVWAVPLFRPAREALAITQQIYARLCEVAPKSQVGAVSVAWAFTQLFAGVPLAEANRFLVADQARHEGHMIAVVEGVLEVSRRCVDALIHGRTRPSLTDELPGLNDYYSDTVIPVFEALVDVLHGDYEAGWRWTSKVTRANERKIGPIWPTPALALLSVICMTERWDSHASERRRMKRISKRHRATAKQWAGRCEANYGPMLDIIDGELASRESRHDDAVNCLERARASAEAGQLTWLAALACERLAAAAKRRGHLTLAETAQENARKAYLRWGASAIVRRFA